MAENLFPVGYENEVADLAQLVEETPQGYKPSSRFDLVAMDFQKNGNHQIQDSNGLQAWEDWCVICLATERYDYAAYNTDFGIETKEAFRAESRSKAESILIREITEALMADPYGRTRYVPEISFDWIGADAVKVQVTVEGIEEVSIDLTVVLDKNRR